MGNVILILGMFALIFTVIIGRPRRGNGYSLRARSPRFLSHYMLDENRHPMGAVVLAGLAAATLSELLGVGAEGLSIAAGLGLLCALSRAAWPFDLIGAAGSVALVAVVLTSSAFSTGARAYFLVGTAALAILLTAGVLLGRLATGSRVFPLVLTFGLLDVLRFVSSPLGVSWAADAPTLRWFGGAIAVLGMGLLVGFAPRLVLPMLAIGITAAELWAATTFPDAAGGSSPFGRVLMVVVFVGIYLGVRRVRIGLATPGRV